MERIGHWARALKRDVVAIWLAARDPRTPLPARALAWAVAGYALSPIDLIPDFIPVLGYLDDLLLLPLGILLVMRMIPPDLWQDFRVRALTILERPRSLLAAGVRSSLKQLASPICQVDGGASRPKLSKDPCGCCR